MEEINRLHHKYCGNIVIPDRSEILSFPPIFKFIQDKDGKTTSVDSLHLTEDDVNEIGKLYPHGIDPALATYTECVLNAILKLKEYYFVRKDKDRNDITSGVIGYLLYILESKCLSFAGYDYVLLT